MRCTVEARGPVPAGQAWDRYARPDRWAEWAPYLCGVDASGDRLVPGLTGRVRGPLRVAVSFLVTGVHEPDEEDPVGRWSWDVRFGPIALTLGHGVEPHRGGSRTWLTVDGPAPVLALYLPLARISLEMLVRRE